MTLRFHNKRKQIREMTSQTLKENTSVTVYGIREIRWRNINSDDNALYSVQVRDGDDLLRICGLQNRVGDYLMQVEDHEFSLSLELAHLTSLQIEQMVKDLYGHQFLLEHRFVRSQQSQTLEQFIQYWKELAKLLPAITRAPAQTLTSSIRETPLHRRQRQTPATLALNLRRGKLTTSSTSVMPTSHTLYSAGTRSTSDLPENAFIAQVVADFEAYAQRLDASLLAAGHYQHSLAKTPFAPPFRAPLPSVPSLPQLPLPNSWKHFRSQPSAANNTVRFHPQYRAVAQLWQDLHNLKNDRQPSAFSLIEECGRRATWELYEFWLVARVARELDALGFECKEGFFALEDTRGATYGLREGGELTFKHPSQLTIRLTYEPRKIDSQGRVLKPDILLEF